LAGSAYGVQQTSPPTSLAAGTSVFGSSSLASFVADASHSTSFSQATTSALSPSAGSDSPASELLLLDQTWSNVDSSSFDHNDDSLYTDASHETMSTSDLALAAVLNEDDEWWNSI
jgi:hypothetical protein